MPSESEHLLSMKNDPAASKVVSLPLTEPSAGESILALERFALTTNNITYAAFGESMRYWEFFPSGEPDWGHMPVWGIARVESSTVAGAEPGQRYYGYLPIADHLRCRPHRISERGFADSTDFRQPLPSAYNYYSRRAENEISGDHANYEMLIRPLFLTSFMLAEYLRDQQYFGADQIVFSSASSKTAYGTAFCLADESISTIALTSARNRDFVERTQLYDDIVVYDELESINDSKATLYVDFHGDETLRQRIHDHFSNFLKHDCFVGSAGNLEPPKLDRSTAVKTKFFFAAEHIKKLNQEIGAALVNEQMNSMQDAFISRIADSDNPWLRIVKHDGLESARDVIRALAKNTVDADAGHVVVL